MNIRKSLSLHLAAGALLALGALMPLPLSAQSVPPAAAPTPDPHHPADQQSIKQSAQPKHSTASPAKSMAGGPMGPGKSMGMMSGEGSDAERGSMMNMAAMMGMMRSMMAAPEAAGPMRAMTGPMGTGHIEGRIAFLRTELKIGDAQTGLWDAYANALRANARALQGMPEKMMAMTPEAPWPDRLGRLEQLLAVRLDGVRVLNTSARALYEALTPEQKLQADALMLGPMGMM